MRNSTDSRDISQSDVGFLHFVERVIGPLLIAATIGLSGWMNSISTVQAELVEKHVTLEEDRADQKKNNQSFNDRQQQMVESQHQIEKDVVEIKTTQKRFGKDIEEIKMLMRDISRKVDGNRD